MTEQAIGPNRREFLTHLGVLGGTKMDHLGFARTAKRDYGIEGVEYVNGFFKDKAKDKAYLGIEYEGDKIGEAEGVRATKALLERVRDAK